MSKSKAAKGAASAPAPATPAAAPSATGGVAAAEVSDQANGKPRGPVEEVIAKRARQLAKKIVSHSSILLSTPLSRYFPT